MNVADSQILLGLSPSTLDKLCAVFQKHDAIEAVFIYGSRAKGNYRVGSDIDLTIKGEVMPFLELMQIDDEIDDLYLPYMIDLSQYKQLKNIGLIEHIDRVGVSVYEKGH